MRKVILDIPSVMSAKMLYRPKEVQHVLGLKRSTFFNLLKSGALPSKKIGSTTVITAETLRKFVDNLPNAA